MDQSERQPTLSAAGAANAHSVLNLAEAAEPHLFGPDERNWGDRVDAELENIRAAMEWSLEQCPEMALRIGAALAVYWSTREVMGEARRWLSAALKADSGASDLVRARALMTLGMLSLLQGDVEAAAAQGSEAVTLARKSGDPLTEANALLVAGSAPWMYGQAEEALPLLEPSLELFRGATTSTERAWAAHTRSVRGLVAVMQGDPELAVESFEEALATIRNIPSDTMLLMTLGNYSDVLMGLGRFTEARAALMEAYGLAMQRKDVWPLGRTLFALASVDAAEGEFVSSAQRLGAAEALLQTAGIAVPTFFQGTMMRTVEQVTAQLGAERYVAEWNFGNTQPGAVAANPSVG